LAGYARDPRRKRPYTELTYLPMMELLKYLRANGCCFQGQADMTLRFP